MVTTLTQENFVCEVHDATKPVLVEFWAERCPACQTMIPLFESASEVESEAKFCKLNVDEEPELANRYEIRSIPTTLLFRSGEPTKRLVGVCSQKALLKLLG